MLHLILQETRERIAKRNDVYVKPMRVLETGEMSRHDRRDGNDAEIKYEGPEQQLSFEGCLQSSRQRTRIRLSQRFCINAGSTQSATAGAD